MATCSPRRFANLPFRFSILLSAAAVTAAAGTVSPQITSMPPNQPVQVIVQYAPSLIGGLLSTVCGVLDLIQLLPGGRIVFDDGVRRDQPGTESFCRTRFGE